LGIDEAQKIGERDGGKIKSVSTESLIAVGIFYVILLPLQATIALIRKSGKRSIFMTTTITTALETQC